MLYYLLFKVLFPMRPEFSVLNVTRYITFRTAAASLTALAISLVLGPWLVRRRTGPRPGPRRWAAC